MGNINYEIFSVHKQKMGKIGNPKSPKPNKIENPKSPKPNKKYIKYISTK